MAMIFDSFPTLGEAEAFAGKVSEMVGLDADAHAERRDDIDPFPFELVAPVVYVERPDYGDDEREVADERLVRSMVDRYHGRFAGT
jgi:hypothetical protein